jgi:2-polyprenyl-3-methyl-5-hydroxy-6-metoxy-1,4-benzoquinol methylase
MSEQKTDLELYSDLASAKTAMKNAKPNSELLHWFADYDDPMYILDFGAGHGRHADALRAMGHKAYAYDPFNGTEDSGWKGVSNKLPVNSFDVVFSTYVLNTTTLSIASDVVEMCERLITPRGGTVLHMVRRDLPPGEQLTKRGTYQVNVVSEFFWERDYEPDGGLWVKEVKRKNHFL